MTLRPALRGILLAAGLYVALTALLARDVLPNLSTRAIHDGVDPLLIAAILKWNASHVPLTDAWWQSISPGRPTGWRSRAPARRQRHRAPALRVVGDPIVE
jgi:hypothetical protein